MNATATFETDRAERYLAALCHHFARKVRVTSDAHRGRVEFPFGLCDLTADETRLELVASADDRTGLDRVVQVITSHLERFAFRENPSLVWQTASAGDEG